MSKAKDLLDKEDEGAVDVLGLGASDPSIPAGSDPTGINPGLESLAKNLLRLSEDQKVWDSLV